MSRQYLDSSLKNSGSQSLSVQLRWSCVQFRRACLWSRGKWMRIHALLDRRPLCRRLLWTVCVEMLTPAAVLNSFRRVVAFTKGWRLVCTTRNRSCLDLVARCRPSAWHWVAEPDVWKRFHALVVTLWFTPKMMATLAVNTHNPACWWPCTIIQWSTDDFDVQEAFRTSNAVKCGEKCSRNLTF